MSRTVVLTINRYHPVVEISLESQVTRFPPNSFFLSPFFFLFLLFLLFFWVLISSFTGCESSYLQSCRNCKALDGTGSDSWVLPCARLRTASAEWNSPVRSLQRIKFDDNVLTAGQIINFFLYRWPSTRILALLRVASTSVASWTFQNTANEQ